MCPVASSFVGFSKCRNGGFGELFDTRKENITNNHINWIGVKIGLHTKRCQQLNGNAVWLQLILQPQRKVSNKHLKQKSHTHIVLMTLFLTALFSDRNYNLSCMNVNSSDYL